LQILESRLGIKPDGSLNLVKSWTGAYALDRCSDSVKNDTREVEDWFFELKDKFSLTGFNYLYFELCIMNQKQYGQRFVKYFENGFYPNRAMFDKTPYYYKSLYYYLLLVTDNISKKFNAAITFLNKNPGKTPKYVSEKDFNRFQMAVSVSGELDEFGARASDDGVSLWERMFSQNEQNYIRNTTGYFLGVSTHEALMSWFSESLPLLQASAVAFAHDISKTWDRQAAICRTRLPLVFFAEEGGTQVSIENLFNETMDKLRLDNRTVDVMIMTALRTWLSKQVRQGIRIEDRLKYNSILADLKASPTGNIFANLYDCRAEIAKLKNYADTWPSVRNKKAVFEGDVMDSLYAAKENMDRIFGDLEKLFGTEQKAGSVNYIFHKYRGEIYYYFKYIQFETFGAEKIMIPAAGPEANYLKNFEAAYIEAPDKPENHINLLNGFNLLFRKLLAEGRVSEIRQWEQRLIAFIYGKYPLGSKLSHTDNNLYDIYRVLTEAYLSSRRYETRALETAKKGFELSKTYYMKAANKAGYLQGGSIGAIIRDNTEMDDFQRQFELYKKVANRSGKKIQLLVSSGDVQLYNRIQRIRTLENF